MIKVKNKKCINNITRKSFKSNKVRNIIAIIAISLTTILFTSLFTVGSIIVSTMEQQNFRQLGTDAHIGFKYMAQENFADIKDHPLVESYTVRRFLGIPNEDPFIKNPLEISYMNQAKIESSFIKLTEGHLPKENTDEIACDTALLELLGVEPRIGEKVTITYNLENGTHEIKVTDTFTLVGFWEKDELTPVLNMLVPNSFIDEIIQREKFIPIDPNYNHTGAFDFSVYLKNANNITGNLDCILEDTGYQNTDSNAENYVNTGINWGYLNSQANANMDAGTMLFIVALVIVFILTGYLVIYNIFQISVIHDIKFYGLLKTIGTTKNQIKQIIIKQALVLSGIGIPIGLLLGFVIGNVVAPFIVSTLNASEIARNINPLIFVGSTLFSLSTVLISCLKPAKFAGKVSPIEALRYTAKPSNKRKSHKKSHKINLVKMAFENITRNKKKTIIVITSLSLAIVVLQLSFTFANGFDMDKYLKKFTASDFMVGNAKYFKYTEIFNRNIALSEQAISDINRQNGITESGRIYGQTNAVNTWGSDENYKESLIEAGMKEKYAELRFQKEERNQKGEMEYPARILGMDQYPLEQLTIVDGSFDEIYKGNPNAIIAVYLEDDYQNPKLESNKNFVGDSVVIRYTDTFQYYNLETDAIIDDLENNKEAYYWIASEYNEKTYEVVATASIKSCMGYRFSSANLFVLNSKVFQDDSGTNDVMTYLLNTSDQENMELFLKDYTTQIDSNLNFTSTKTVETDFNEFKKMFETVGGLLSLIIGFIGILNFFNAILTSILTRKREFAMLQSIGMTGKQLNTMLVFEGLCYSVLTIILTIILTLITAPMLEPIMSSMFWFFSYQFTLLPIIIVAPIFMLLSIIMPISIYKFISKQTIVERLRTTE